MRNFVSAALRRTQNLAPEEKARAATAIMLTYMNELYRGKAVFTAEGENQ